MNELDVILEAHRRDNRRAEAVFDLLFITAAGLVLGVLHLLGVA